MFAKTMVNYGLIVVKYYGSGNIYVFSYLMVMALYDLNEKCWSVLHWFAEDLQQVPVFVVVDQNFQLL